MEMKQAREGRGRQEEKESWRPSGRGVILTRGLIHEKAGVMAIMKSTMMR